MDGACLRYTELPGTSRLFADYLYDFPKVAQFYRHAPRKQSSFHDSLASIQYPDARRAQIVAALRPNNANSKSLDRLAQPGTVAVVTGQQVGLFTGPAYTIFKAVTAASVARQLTSDGIPAVPVFWLATEDHDFPEIAAAHVFDAEGSIHTFHVATSGEADRPVGGIVPDNGFPLDQLEQALSGFPFAADVMSLVREAHASSDQSMGGTFLATLRRLLAPLDLIFLDPLTPAIRDIGADFLADAVRQAPALYPKLIARGKELTDAGYHAQVHVEADTSLFFVLEDGHRIPLKRAKEGGYKSKNTKYSDEELASRAASISPNALLRPVLQDFLLPTIAYVGGPAELAYFAQSEVLYEALLQRMPVMLPRNGFTLLDARSQKLLQRYQIALPAAFTRSEALRANIAAKLVPNDVRALLDETKANAIQLLDRLDAGLADFDPSLSRVTAKSKAKMLHQLTRTVHKAERETLRRDERASGEASHLSNHLYPHDHLQERYFSILPFLAQYGLDLVDTVVTHSCIDCVDHHVLHLS
ncbi:putative cysteine ligase BshC [Bryobacterales bacterium F-183]|nr:putative cysteine ligase BshC [Bryobacterales bacterium F-183]